MSLLIEGDNVKDVRFQGRGCAISQASASILTEEIKGKTLAEVRAIDRQHILENLGIPISPARIKCALLSLKTLKGAAWGLSEWPGEDRTTSTARANGE
jgi:nitrogen fixation NifU-like protein